MSFRVGWRRALACGWKFWFKITESLCRPSKVEICSFFAEMSSYLQIGRVSSTCLRVAPLRHLTLSSWPSSLDKNMSLSDDAPQLQDSQWRVWWCPHHTVLTSPLSRQVRKHWRCSVYWWSISISWSISDCSILLSASNAFLLLDELFLSLVSLDSCSFRRRAMV